MDNIQIHFENGTQVADFSLEVYLNKIPVPFTVKDNIIIIETELDHGVNFVKLKLLSEFNGESLKMTAFYLNESISRHTLFLTYAEVAGVKTSSTWLGFYPEITIPFGNPMSWWICECSQKIKYKDFSTNVYQDYEIFYPESLTISNEFPRMMRDWFRYNFKIHVYRKDDLKDFETNRRIPYFKINFDYDNEGLYQELHNNIEAIVHKKRTHKERQDTYNQKDGETLTAYQSVWTVYDTVLPCDRGDNLWAWKQTSVPTPEQFPKFHQLLEQITNKGIKIAFVFISQTDGHSFVAPHGHQEDYGFYQLTFPLGWTNDSYFKIDGVGLLPTDSAFVINSSDYLHGTVNPTDKTRYVIGVCCEFQGDYSILSDFKPY